MKTNFDQPYVPEPLELGRIHRNCGYCGRTYYHTLLEHQSHIHKCEAERVKQVYGILDVKDNAICLECKGSGYMKVGVLCTKCKATGKVDK